MNALSPPLTARQMLLSQILKAIRVRRGLRSSEAARAMGMPLRSYQHFESARGREDVPTIHAFSDAVNADGHAIMLALEMRSAKNQSSYLTWGEARPQVEVAATLRRDFLVSPERAGKLSGAWGRHPLLGRMYLPAYRAGTRKVAALRRVYKPEVLLPVSSVTRFGRLPLVE